MKTRSVNCPNCGRRIISEDINICTLTKVIRNTERQPRKKDDWQPQHYIKCWKCGSKIGFRVT